MNVIPEEVEEEKKSEEEIGDHMDLMNHYEKQFKEFRRDNRGY